MGGGGGQPIVSPEALRPSVSQSGVIVSSGRRYRMQGTHWLAVVLAAATAGKLKPTTNNP